jgi:transcriptional regulator with XRE-family HTH domain
VLRIMLGTELRRLRQASGVTAEVAARAIQASRAKISRMERGRVGFKDGDVADLLTLYGVTDQHQRGRVLALARRANVPDWWYQYSDLLPSWDETYLGLEQASSVIRTYQPQLVPSLLQTPEVAAGILRFLHPREPPHAIERRVALQMSRQEILTHPDAPQLWAVIDQAALWRLGQSAVLREQIQHLITMAQLPHVRLQLLPVYSGEYVAIGGPFTILRFAEPTLPDIVYLQQHTTALYLDRDEDVQHYRALMDRVCVLAKSPTKTINDLNTILADPQTQSSWLPSESNHGEQVGLPAAVEELLADVARDGFTLHCCGPRATPNALVASYHWDQHVDVLTIQDFDRVTAARVPKHPALDIFAPEVVVWAYQGPPQQTLRALLNLVHPAHPDAPTTAYPAPASLQVPPAQQRPMTIRPPSPSHTGIRAARLRRDTTSSSPPSR